MKDTAAAAAVAATPDAEKHLKLRQVVPLYCCEGLEEFRTVGPPFCSRVMLSWDYGLR